MTYDEIMSLSGRELDAAVAEHIYGREIEWRDKVTGRSPFCRDKSSYLFGVPLYCEHAAEALDILKLVLSHDNAARDTFFPALWSQAGIPEWFSVPMDDAQLARRWCERALTSLVLEDRLSEAICRAAVYATTRPWWTVEETAADEEGEHGGDLES
ncbi:MAG: hypothetical protein VB144_11720 [Clostridia bacterium]|nr:hypothetical protein [Clostridia bacterium]